jgi:hypothetical protein
MAGIGFVFFSIMLQILLPGGRPTSMLYQLLAYSCNFSPETSADGKELQ